MAGKKSRQEERVWLACGWGAATLIQAVISRYLKSCKGKKLVA
jgi:hypothetical protein